jgi:hypothetical protein
MFARAEKEEPREVEKSRATPFSQIFLLASVLEEGLPCLPRDSICFGAIARIPASALALLKKW